MDARAIATEMAPVIMWQKERKPETYRSYWNNLSRSPSKKNMDPAPTYSAWDMLSGESLSQTIYLHYTYDEEHSFYTWQIKLIQGIGKSKTLTALNWWVSYFLLLYENRRKRRHGCILTHSPGWCNANGLRCYWHCSVSHRTAQCNLYWCKWDCLEMNKCPGLESTENPSC